MEKITYRPFAFLLALLFPALASASDLVVEPAGTTTMSVVLGAWVNGIGKRFIWEVPPQFDYSIPNPISLTAPRDPSDFKRALIELNDYALTLLPAPAPYQGRDVIVVCVHHEFVAVRLNSHPTLNCPVPTDEEIEAALPPLPPRIDAFRETMK